LGAIDTRADQKILFLFCLFVFWQKKKEDFLRLAKRTLVSFDKQPVTLLLCFGVFDKKDVKHLGLLGWWSGMTEEYKRRKCCKKDNSGWFCAMAGYFRALAPLVWQTGSFLDFAFTLKNKR